MEIQALIVDDERIAREGVQMRLEDAPGVKIIGKCVNGLEALIAQIPEQINYENYRDVDGIKMPFTIRLSLVDPWSGWMRKFTEIKHDVPVDANKFDLPPAAK